MKSINKDTKIYGSFSIKAGNNGCKTFNALFNEYNMDAIYKSFSVSNIEDVIISAKTLGFSGFAVSMPYKVQILPFLDEVDEIASKIGAVNTVVIEDNRLKGYNTDFISVKEVLEEKGVKHLHILGDGGFSKSVKYACEQLNITYEVITRKNWSDIKYLRDCVVFNCTPVENIKLDNSVDFIDGIPTTKTGIHLAKKQSIYQFELYTNKKLTL